MAILYLCIQSTYMKSPFFRARRRRVYTTMTNRSAKVSTSLEAQRGHAFERVIAGLLLGRDLTCCDAQKVAFVFLVPHSLLLSWNRLDQQLTDLRVVSTGLMGCEPPRCHQIVNNYVVGRRLTIYRLIPGAFTF